MLTYRHVETALKCKKGPSVLKAMAATGFEQYHLFLLYQSVVLGVTDNGRGSTTVGQTNLQKLDRVQNEAKRVTLGTITDTPTEPTRLMLDLPPMQTRQKMEQFKAYFGAVENPHNPFHKTVKDTKRCRLGRAMSWMGHTSGETQYCKYSRAQANQGVGKVLKLIPASL